MPAKTTATPFKDELQTRYKSEIVPRLKERFKFSNNMQVPRVQKVVLNMGLGEAIADIKVLDKAIEQLTLISGQKPLTTEARKSIATFKLRQGAKIGACVTLRGIRMYAFLNRLMNVALPRVKDFKGVNKRGMDGRGNYTLGIKEQTIFPEVPFEKVDRVRGLNITIVTTAPNDEQGLELLKEMGMPFRN